MTTAEEFISKYPYHYFENKYGTELFSTTRIGKLPKICMDLPELDFNDKYLASMLIL